ncbi:MAG: sortase domain-bontaining protein, partial [Chloroflexus sp.]
YLQGLPVNYYPTEGMAQRGGFVKAQVRLGRSFVGPNIPEKGADLAISMELSESLKAVRFLKPGADFVLWGHVLRFRKAPHIPAPFADVERLPIGSEILLYSADGTVFRYLVARKERVTPDQVQYILPTGDERLTLVSCIGDRVIVEGNVELTHRLITIATPAP